MEVSQLCQKRLAASGRGPRPPQRMLDMSPEKLTLALFYGLMAALSEEPCVLWTKEGTTVTALFRDSCYDSADFLLGYQALMAAIDRDWTLTVYGTVNGAETGELRAQLGPEGICYTQSDVSGQAFTQLSDLCVTVITQSTEQAAFLVEALGRLRVGVPCAIVCRRNQALCHKADLAGMTDGTHFLYLPMEEGGEPAQYLDGLTLQDKAELWREYLTEGISGLEFDWFLENYQAGQSRGLLEWELALRTVLPELGVTVENVPEQFRITGANGHPMRLSYEQAPAAGKLLLKIIFPVKPGIK